MAEPFGFAPPEAQPRSWSDYLPELTPDGQAVAGAAKAIGKSLWNTVTTPARLMQPNPYPAGSEEAQWYADNNAKQATEWGPEMALNTFGIGGPASMIAGAKNALGSAGAKGIKTYHVSPHDFDRFDLSKIGTGEGAQVFGHGIYTAESPAVSGRGGSYWDMFLNRMKDNPESRAAAALRASAFDAEKAAALTQERIDRYKGMAKAAKEENLYADVEKGHLSLARQEQATLRKIKSGEIVGPRTYEVNINSHPNNFLDWDKPLRDQSGQVKEAFMPFAEPAAAKQNEARAKMLNRGVDFMGRPFSPEKLQQLKEIAAPGDYTGERLHQMLTIKHGATAPRQKQAEAMADIRESGLHGIKYMDQLSRPPTVSLDRLKEEIATLHNKIKDAPNPEWQTMYRQQLEQHMQSMKNILNPAPPTRNYVVNDDRLLDILKKYAVPGMLGGGTAFGSLAPGSDSQ